MAQRAGYAVRGKYEDAVGKFTNLGNYKDSKSLKKEISKIVAEKYETTGNTEKAIFWYDSIGDKTKVKELMYNYVTSHKNRTDTLTYEYLVELTASNYRDSKTIYGSLYTFTIEASIKNAEDTPRGNTFQMYGYRGCISDLFAIVEQLAVVHGLVDQIVNIPKSAWGAPSYSPFYERNTSLTPENLDTFFEQFHYLINQNVLSPGAYGNYGDNLPYFHVTQYGLKCMGEKEILPHDPDGYIAKIKATRQMRNTSSSG